MATAAAPGWPLRRQGATAAAPEWPATAMIVRARDREACRERERKPEEMCVEREREGTERRGSVFSDLKIGYS